MNITSPQNVTNMNITSPHIIFIHTKDTIKTTKRCIPFLMSDL